MRTYIETPHEIVQGQTFAPVKATFYCGSDLAERYFFEEWQKITYNPIHTILITTKNMLVQLKYIN